MSEQQADKRVQPPSSSTSAAGRPQASAGAGSSSDNKVQGSPEGLKAAAAATLPSRHGSDTIGGAGRGGDDGEEPRAKRPNLATPSPRRVRQRRRLTPATKQSSGVGLIEELEVTPRVLGLSPEEVAEETERLHSEMIREPLQPSQQVAPHEPQPQLQQRRVLQPPPPSSSSSSSPMSSPSSTRARQPLAPLDRSSSVRSSSVLSRSTRRDQLLRNASQVSSRASSFMARVRRKPRPNLPPVGTLVHTPQDTRQFSPPSELRLPAHCTKLLRQFEQLDIIGSHVVKKYLRTFDRVQPGVEKMTKRSFTLQDLGRIMHIWPESYKLEQVLIKDSQRGTGEYKLKLTPCMQSEDGEVEQRRYLSVADIHDRVSLFRGKLLAYVHEHHEKHLATLPGSPSVPLTKLQRWHSGFDLQSVPEIPVGEVPHPPQKTIMTATEALNKSLGLTAGAQQALEKTVEHSERTVELNAKPVSRNASPQARVSSALEGLVSDDMMSRIRAKQKKRTEATLQLTSAASRRRSLLKRLPTIATTIWMEGRRRPAGPMDRWLPSIGKSCGLSNTEVENHINLLAEIMPTFVKRFLRDNRTPYMKVTTSIPLAKIKKAIQDEERKLGADS